ncbi:uncharacterized protein LOC112541544 [Python bivittatus]|uniref:Uncharacterized protein LOC112541544 n=1 Tax=Python bivittatus TaxID=176946 RepID=A0A9F5J8G5_PYTBI|nr:uncharacterized protein LOC112541544 [Python bivittatus]
MDIREENNLTTSPTKSYHLEADDSIISQILMKDSGFYSFVEVYQGWGHMDLREHTTKKKPFAKKQCYAQLINAFPLPERTWSFWKEPQDGGYSWYHSLQVLGERFEDHVKTIALLLQKLDRSVEDQVGALDKLVSNHVKNLWEWLEDHIKDLNVWLNMYFWAVQEFHDRFTKHPDYMLGKAILLHDNYWNDGINKADSWLEHPNSTLYMWLEEAPLIFYKTLKMQGSNIKKYTETHIQHIEDHVRALEQLLDNYTSTANKWLEDYAAVKETSSQNFTWDFSTVGSKAQMLGRALVTALQGKCLMVMKWLEENVEGIEQLLWNIINW